MSGRFRRYADFANGMALREHDRGVLFILVLSIGTCWLPAFLFSRSVASGPVPALLFVTGFFVSGFIIIRRFRKDSWPMTRDAYFRKTDG